MFAATVLFLGYMHVRMRFVKMRLLRLAFEFPYWGRNRGLHVLFCLFDLLARQYGTFQLMTRRRFNAFRSL